MFNNRVCGAEKIMDFCERTKNIDKQRRFILTWTKEILSLKLITPRDIGINFRYNSNRVVKGNINLLLEIAKILAIIYGHH